MASRVPTRTTHKHISLIILFVVLPFCSSNNVPPNPKPIFTNGTLNLSILWYGEFNGTVQLYENVIGEFVKSLNREGKMLGMEPSVATWWEKVESYQCAAVKGKDSPKKKLKENEGIEVKIVKSTYDPKWSFGQDLKPDCIPKLTEKATGGNTCEVALVFTSKEVKVEGLCKGSCQKQGLIGNNQAYILVGNPIETCPGKCALPFYKPDLGPLGITYRPPNEDIGVDSMIIHFATALVDLVTNPQLDGFPIQSQHGDFIQAGSVCAKIFGSGSFEGYSGKMRLDPTTGGGFNVHGGSSTKYLIPGVWDPKNSSCWTTM